MSDDAPRMNGHVHDEDCVVADFDSSITMGTTVMLNLGAGGRLRSQQAKLSVGDFVYGDDTKSVLLISVPVDGDQSMLMFLGLDELTILMETAVFFGGGPHG